MVGHGTPSRPRRVDRAAASRRGGALHPARPRRRRRPGARLARGARARGARGRRRVLLGTAAAAGGGRERAVGQRRAVGAHVAGRVTNDTFAPVRTLLSGGGQSHRVARRAPRARMYRGASIPRARPPLPVLPRSAGAGRSSRAGGGCRSRATATASLLLDRYGVVTRRAGRAVGGRARRVRAGVPHPRRLRRGRSLPPRLRHREARRRAVRRVGDRRSSARVRGRRRSTPAPGGHTRRHRSGQPLRRRPRMARHRRCHSSTRAQGRRARVCSSTAS